MKVLMVEPGKAPYETEIEGGLESLQKAVGGSIQAVYPYDDPVALICNEEGKLMGLPLNRSLTDDNGEIYDIIADGSYECKAAQTVELRVIGYDQVTADGFELHHVEIPEVAVAARNDEIAAHTLQRIERHTAHRRRHARQPYAARHAHDLRKTVPCAPVCGDLRTVLEDKVATDLSHILHPV